MNIQYDPDNFTPGEMDTAGHQSTFGGFVKTCIIVTAITIVVLIFLLLVAY